jgi:hypothetical protein
LDVVDDVTTFEGFIDGGFVTVADGSVREEFIAADDAVLFAKRNIQIYSC